MPVTNERIRRKVLQEELTEEYKCDQCNTQLNRVKELFVLTKIERISDKRIRLDNHKGIPVVTFVCPNCGKFAIFSAKRLGEI